MSSMIERLVALLQGLPPELVTLIVGALPVAEIRGAIPVGVALGLSLPAALMWGLAGNFLPIAPILLFLNPIQRWLRRFRFWRLFFRWLFKRTAAKAGIVRRYQAIGLTLFVAVPLPMTGAWTGCAAALLFNMPFRLAFPAISSGVVLAGFIVALAVRLGIALFAPSFQIAS